MAVARGGEGVGVREPLVVSSRGVRVIDEGGIALNEAGLAGNSPMQYGREC